MLGDSTMLGTLLRHQLFSIAVAVVIVGSTAPQTNAQSESTVPGDLYFAAMTPFYQGDYKTSMRTFRDAAQSGVRSSQGRWVDSICYHTMAGECYYHMGQLSLALEQYEAALNIYLVHRRWLTRVQPPAAVRAAVLNGREVPNWGRSTRATQIALFPDRMMSQQGTDVERAFQQGGVVSTPRLVPIVAQEVMRCTALAIRRRGELLGPYGKYDSMNKRLVSTLTSQTPANWLRPVHNVQLGMAQLAAGRTEEGTKTLSRSLVVFGNMDHPLTGMALLELGKVNMANGKYSQAAQLLSSATFSAAAYSQADIVEESFRYLGAVESVVGGQSSEVYERAALWAKAQRFDRMQASLLITAAERKLAAGQIRPAAGTLEQARRTIRRQDVSRGDVGGRAMYLAAMIDSGNANPKAAAATATAFYRTGSHWLFHIELAQRLYKSNTLDGRQASSLFKKVLREPTSTDWRFNTEESMAYMLADKSKPLADWYEIALKRNDEDLMLTIADELRRQRFLRSQPLGGRLVGLRWVLEAPDKLITKSTLDRRKEILGRYPYKELATRAKQLKTELAPLSLESEERAVRDRLKALSSELEKVSAAQEAILRQIAFRREPSRLLYPPRLNVKSLQEEMLEGQAILTFAVGSRATSVFLVSRSSVKTWQVSTALLRKHLADMLREIGNVDRNQSLTIAQLQDDSWSKSAGQLRTQLLGDLPKRFWDETNEIIIVPDDFLWYLPFEALPLDDEASSNLLAKVRVRYLPLVSLAAKRRQHPGEGPTTLIAGELFPRTGSEANSDAIAEQKEAIEGTVMLTTAPMATSSSLAGLWRRLIVIDDIDDADRNALAWSPLQIDRGRPSSSLQDWMRLPWGTPDQVLLPGFHSSAEASLKKNRNGDDLFLPICGLMCEGTQTVLISRWRTGGATSIRLVREFSQELPHGAAADAWQRAVLLLGESELEWQNEPRIKSAASTEESLTADHPFFWAGNILVDQGATPTE